MSNIFTLDSMREEIEREFAPFQISVDGQVLTLRNVLRLPKKDREQVYGLLDQMGQQEDETGLSSTERSATVALKIIPLVSDSKPLATALVKQIEDDMALTLKVFAAWMEGTQAGEADGSGS